MSTLNPLAESADDCIRRIRALRPSLGARLFYRLCPIRRDTMLSNMKIVFGDKLTDEDRTLLAQGFCDHLLRLVFENVQLAWMSDETVRAQIRIVGHEIILKAAAEGKGILCMTGHFGNWELSPVAAIMHFPQFKNRFHFLRRPIGTKWIEKTLFSRFYKGGLGIIPKRNSLSTILEKLSQNDVVVFIMDQYARPGKDGIPVDFFGRKAGTFKSLALVASQSGAPVIPTISYREASGRHVMQFLEPVRWVENEDPTVELYENTRRYNRAMEEMVLAHPDQWWWPHRRWKVK